jgi:hypothetical protein
MIRRNGESEFLGLNLEKIAAKNQYTIMGATPGDGGVYYGDSPEEATAQYIVEQETYSKASDKAKDLKKWIKRIEDDTKAGRTTSADELEKMIESGEIEDEKNHKYGLKETSEGVWEWGTYEVKLVRESFEEWLSGKKFVNLETNEKTSYDKLPKEQQEKIRLQYEQDA